jgi:hypothetical protein
MKTCSQAHQDIFVSTVTQQKRNGWYLEVGSNHPINTNNTFLLESEYDWTGISVEFLPDMVNLFNSVRKNKCFRHDATTFDFERHLKENNFPKQIDYLSLDIEPPSQTYFCLTKIPLKEYTFSVITFEHDCYYAGDEYKLKAFNLLTELGYERVISNVKWSGLTFEDWYVNPSLLPPNSWQHLKSENIEHAAIKFT